MKFYFAIIAALLFITGCSNEPDITTTQKGIRFLDVKTGTGEEVKKGNKVSIHFTGWIINDSTDLFSDWSTDSTKMMHIVADSRRSGNPAVFVLDSVSFAPGIDDAMAGMKKGGIRTVILPPVNDPQNPMANKPGFKLVVELLDFKEYVPVKMWEADTSKIQTQSSGLKYIVIKEGEGENAKPGNFVTVHYSGFFTDGRKFDSSIDSEEPINFQLGQRKVINGWEEGITLMNKGSKIKLIVPPSLAYGDEQYMMIPPNSTLVFDIELLDIK
ncbi:MAG: FKBP-type peptidyl-prolyl cis-trans isomerase [Ignavibacteriales bacterium]|nr:MAG: FKBP-type peptidyl-prolyl cis-trans isomerase [Ignavibacteriales bacterium]